MSRKTRLLAIGCSAVAGLALTGCGETRFSADQFVDEANGRGATLELGNSLLTTEENKELYELRLKPLAAAEGPAGDLGEARTTAGSLAVYEGGEGAARGVRECEAAVDLLCYRAANVVIVLEGAAVGPEQVALAAAIREMAE